MKQQVISIGHRESGVVEERARELLPYYEGQEAQANRAYVKSGKLADRLAAVKLKGKVEALQQLLGTNRQV